MLLADRMKLEREFRKEIWALLDARPEPAAFARGVEALVEPIEDNAYVAIILLLLFMGDSWPAFQDVVDQAMRRGTAVDGEIRRRASRLARRQVRTLRRRVVRTNRRWVDRMTDEEFAARAFGRERAEAIAVTELTTTINQAEFEAVEMARAAGVVVAGYWYTQKDERVCPVCAPLHGAPESVWRRVFPRGGPAHVRCRCGIRWVLVPPGAR